MTVLQNKTAYLNTLQSQLLLFVLFFSSNRFNLQQFILETSIPDHGGGFCSVQGLARWDPSLAGAGNPSHWYAKTSNCRFCFNLN